MNLNLGSITDPDDLSEKLNIDIVAEGSMTKKSATKAGKWEKRWFILDYQAIVFYKDGMVILSSFEKKGSLLSSFCLSGSVSRGQSTPGQLLGWLRSHGEDGRQRVPAHTKDAVQGRAHRGLALLPPGGREQGLEGDVAPAH